VCTRIFTTAKFTVNHRKMEVRRLQNRGNFLHSFNELCLHFYCIFILPQVIVITA
jgi:hypothetical protein